MILIKYTPTDFKDHCPDYHHFNTYDEYKNGYAIARYFLKENNHNVIEIEFHEDDYLAWIEEANIQDCFLAHQSWAGSIHKGGNAKKSLTCIVCNEAFEGRANSKFCSSICRSKNHREIQKVARKEKKIKEAIAFAKFIGIEKTNDKIIDYINEQPKWKRDDLLSINPKNKNHKKANKKRIRNQKELDLSIKYYKDIFDKLNNEEELKSYEC